ncbi:hypothetical protein D3C83_120800 [compost metagenome]
MQGDGQLDHAQAGAEMPARTGDRMHQEVAQLVGDRGQFGFRQGTQVGGRVYRRQERKTGLVYHGLG